MKKHLPAALSFLVPIAVYTLTLAPSVTLEDSGEYMAVAANMGVAHPPGAPLWCLLGHAATRVPIGSIAQRTNFLSAVCGAFASLFLFLWLFEETRRWDIALAASGVAAFSRCIWGESVVTEVYSLNLMMIFLCLWLAGRWRRTGCPRWLMATALAGGLEQLKV